MTKQVKVIIAFALVYVLWGSTYLAIHFAIGTIPPFLMVGTRFMIAGAAMYAFARLRGGPRPGRYAMLGIILGLFGVGLLVGRGKGVVEPVGALALVVCSMAWSAGTLFARRANMPKSTFLTTGMEMLAGGVINIAVGFLTGEGAHLQLAAVSRDSLFGLVYLIIFGSWIGYSAYTYLTTAVTPAQLGTYAYVNPCIALMLGWLIAGETIGPRTVVAMGIIVGAVLLLTVKPAAAQRPEAGSAKVSPSASRMASSTK